MKVDLKKISTEQRNKNTVEIYRANSLDIAKMLNEEDKTVPLAVETQIIEIAKAIDICVETINNGGRIVYSGAGTSGRLGILDASEMPPTFNVPKTLVIGIIAGGRNAIENPVEGAEDNKEQAIKDMEEVKFTSKDVLVGLSASGRTPYVISMLEHARKIGAKTISISTSKKSEIGQIADIGIDAVTGAEPITGSTRMKSGTAQKLILNMISTGTMVRLGKVYKNLMVDVVALNEKLIERTKKIVSEITGVSYEEATPYLIKTDFNPKEAIVMILKDVDVLEARKLLKKYNGVLKEII